jgi:hypothetical protein
MTHERSGWLAEQTSSQSSAGQGWMVKVVRGRQIGGRHWLGVTLEPVGSTRIIPLWIMERRAALEKGRRVVSAAAMARSVTTLLSRRAPGVKLRSIVTDNGAAALKAGRLVVAPSKVRTVGHSLREAGGKAL